VPDAAISTHGGKAIGRGKFRMHWEVDCIEGGSGPELLVKKLAQTLVTADDGSA
jgi:hypothetical protein